MPRLSPPHSIVACCATPKGRLQRGNETKTTFYIEQIWATYHESYQSKPQSLVRNTFPILFQIYANDTSIHLSPFHVYFPLDMRPVVRR